MKLASLAAIVVPAVWIAGWTVYVWDGVEGRFSSVSLTQEFTTKESASEFLARCPDCEMVRKQKTSEFFCCDHKTLNEAHE